MKKEDKDALHDDLQEICEKYNIENAAFCGDCVDNEFIGFLVIGEVKAKNTFPAIMNIGRLWQHARTVVRDLMNDWEKAK